MEIGKTISWCITFLAIALLIHLFVSQPNLENTEVVNKIVSTPVQKIANDKVHWNHMPITYSLEGGCIGKEPDRIYAALDTIVEQTSGTIYFDKVESNADVTFVCYPYQNIRVEEDRKIFTQAQTTTNFSGSEMLNAKIEIFSVSETTYPESCYNFPAIELHEILHTFGVSHKGYISSIMYPYQEGCDFSDVESIIRELNEQYN